MKAAFKECMTFLYPEGLEAAKEQWRDLIRTFVMGWNEALRSTGNRAAAGKSMPITQSISAPGWMPDESWKWW